MALKKCPVCGKEISDQASKCPHCGYEKERVTGENQNENVVSNHGNKKILFIGGGIAVVLLIGVCAFLATSNIRKYRSAENAFKNGKFSEAQQVFQDLGDYKDAKEQIKECSYMIGKESFEAGKYEDSMKTLSSISGYKDADDLYEQAEHQNLVTKDTTPPEFSEFLDSTGFEAGFDFDIEKWSEKQEITVTDDVTENIQYTVDKGDLDINVPGEYTIVFTAEDEAGNIAEKKVIVTVREKKSETYKAYREAINVRVSALKKRDASYYYNDIQIISEEISWLSSAYGKNAKSLNQGALYRSMAKKLQGFYLFDGEYYGNWKGIVPQIFNFSAPSTWEEMKPYVDEASTFITGENGGKAILDKLKTSQYVTGDIDAENMKFNFTISDTSALADEWNINEAMLGYTLAVFSEYNAMSEFNGAACTFVLE